MRPLVSLLLQWFLWLSLMVLCATEGAQLTSQVSNNEVAANSNHTVRIHLVGGAGVLPGGDGVNRTAAGANIRLRSKPSNQVQMLAVPSTHNGSVIINDALGLTFDIGDDTSADFIVFWPPVLIGRGPHENYFQDLLAGEQVDFPEIPCNYNVATTAATCSAAYTTCVETACAAWQQTSLVESVFLNRVCAMALGVCTPDAESASNIPVIVAFAVLGGLLVLALLFFMWRRWSTRRYYRLRSNLQTSRRNYPAPELPIY